MKKLFFIFLALLFFGGCAHNEHMAQIEQARWEAYGQAMAAYYQSLPANRGEIVDLQVDDTGKLSGLKVFASDQKLPPRPPEPEEIKPWGSQITDSIANSKTVDTVAKMAAGVFAIKIISENAGDNVRDSYNDNRTSEQVTTTSSVDTDTSTITDSYNSDQQSTVTETTQSYADSYNTDQSVNDGYNQDTDNSINDSYGQDNRQNYDNDSRQNYENDNGIENIEEGDLVTP